MLSLSVEINHMMSFLIVLCCPICGALYSYAGDSTLEQKATTPTVSLTNCFKVIAGLRACFFVHLVSVKCLDLIFLDVCVSHSN